MVCFPLKNTLQIAVPQHLFIQTVQIFFGADAVEVKNVVPDQLVAAGDGAKARIPRSARQIAPHARGRAILHPRNAFLRSPEGIYQRPYVMARKQIA